jgi:hypothetical protein
VKRTFVRLGILASIASTGLLAACSSDSDDTAGGAAGGGAGALASGGSSGKTGGAGAATGGSSSGATGGSSGMSAAAGESAGGSTSDEAAGSSGMSGVAGTSTGGSSAGAGGGTSTAGAAGTGGASTAGTGGTSTAGVGGASGGNGGSSGSGTSGSTSGGSGGSSGTGTSGGGVSGGGSGGAGVAGSAGAGGGTTTVESSWVEIGANSQASARVITSSATCPSITVDGAAHAMTVRAAPVTLPLRTTSTDTTLSAAQTSGNSKPSVFASTTCEFDLPAGAAAASVGGVALPVPKSVVNRVVIIGDTGCRISIGNVYQACSDPTQWPFSVIAAATAAMKPDLVLHVGDYEYRDNPCPAGNTACAGQPWGYGSDAWAADFFTPAAPLLAAAPWVMVRGNHEVCNRAGQGWYRYLDENPFDSSDVKTCDDPTNDSVGNFNDPWGVSFGDTQIIAFDSSGVSKTAYSPATFQPYTAELAGAASLSSSSLLNIFAVHHPVLGYTAANPPTLGSPGLQSVMNAAFPGNYYPPNTAIAIHGHVHDFQAFDFSSNHPATFVAGNGGDNLDSALPATFNPNTDLPAPNTVVNAFAYSQEFGFMVMDRVGAVGDKNWKFTSYRTDGSVIAVCSMVAASACSGVCDSTPGSRISCTDGGGSAVGTYDNIQ